jgi:hypothetical protein
MTLLQSGRAILALGTLAALTACGTGSGTGPMPAERGPLMDDQAAPTASLGSDIVKTVYLASRDAGQIVGFPVQGNGNISPSVLIAGPHTQVQVPVALAVDKTGHLYAANDSGREVLIFAPNANGDATPQVLGGSNVPLQATEGIAIDPSGQIYVSDFIANAIYVFAAGATGNTAPIRTIVGANTQLISPLGMAFDKAGNLLVANNPFNSLKPILKFSATANGNVAPISFIGGANTQLFAATSVSVDAKGRIIVPAYEGSSVLIFKAGAHGNATPGATISGALTGFTDVTSAAVDPKGEIFVANDDFSTSTYSLFVFPSTANGNVAPIRTISGSNTGINNPFYPSFH